MVAPSQRPRAAFCQGLAIAPELSKYAPVGKDPFAGLANSLQNLVVGRFAAVVPACISVLWRVEPPAIDAVVAQPVLGNRVRGSIDCLAHSRATAAVVELWQAAEAQKRGRLVRPLLEGAAAIVGRGWILAGT